MGRYKPRFSHEFEAGPSGPARSYWDIQTNGGSTVATVCLHPGTSGKLQAEAICWTLDAAFEAGRADKARELRIVLGV